MKRRTFLGLAGAFAVPPVLAQQTRPFRIYMVTWRGLTQVESGFQDYLSQRKVKTQYIMRDAAQNPERLTEFVKEIKLLKPDLVYTWGTSATLGIFGNVTQTEGVVRDLPGIFTLVASPVETKIVASLADPGGNLTGVYHVAPLEMQIAAMRTYRKFAKIGVLYNGAEQNSVAIVKELEALAGKEQFAVIKKTFHMDAAGKPASDGIAGMIGELKRSGADWLYIGPDSFLFSTLEQVTAAAIAEHLPTFASTEAAVESPAGVLAGLVSKYYSIGQFTGYKAEQILVKKIAPRNLPVETLKRFSFVVRMETAKKLGVLPPVVLFNYAEFI